MSANQNNRGGVKFIFLVGFLSAVVLGAVTKDAIMSFVNTTNGQKLQQIITEAKDAVPVASLPLTPEVKLQGEETGRVNVLILGIGGEDHPGSLLTDTIMLASFDTVNIKADIFSIPRDLAVSVPGRGTITKINALYEFSGSAVFPNPGGVDLIQQKVQEITGIKAQYYFIADFDALTQVIDDVGGISIPQEDSLKDKTFPTDDRGFETFAVQRGWRYLNGQDALKYVRTRHTGNGDFDRMRRQHTVLLALKQKIQGLNSVKDLPTIIKIYQHAQSHIASNASIGEIQRVWNITKGFSQGNVEFHVISSEPDNLLVSKIANWDGQQAYTLQPKAGLEDYSQIQQFIQQILSPTT
ncbi:MAG: LCP family protein [Candidatus Spechtbacteria bacterium]|nr:LCP family protein [Candidatus Spechtbacteria bacterium]